MMDADARNPMVPEMVAFTSDWDAPSAPVPQRKPRTGFGVVGFILGAVAIVALGMALRRLAPLAAVEDAASTIKDWGRAIVWNGNLQMGRLLAIASVLISFFGLPFALVGRRSTIGKVALVISLVSFGGSIAAMVVTNSLTFVDEDALLESASATRR